MIPMRNFVFQILLNLLMNEIQLFHMLEAAVELLPILMHRNSWFWRCRISCLTNVCIYFQQPCRVSQKAIRMSRIQIPFKPLVLQSQRPFSQFSAGKHLLVAYWGQTSSGTEKDLTEVCTQRKYDIVVIGFVVKFFGENNKGTACLLSVYGYIMV